MRSSTEGYAFRRISPSGGGGGGLRSRLRSSCLLEALTLAVVLEIVSGVQGMRPKACVNWRKRSKSNAMGIARTIGMTVLMGDFGHHFGEG